MNEFMRDNIKDLVSPIRFIPFKNFKKPVRLGFKNNKPRALKQKRNIILKINLPQII
tara:strand:- start:3808 stop:3978 length:171 start_codon:yes stop_codon:yes gene_type:complete